MASNPSTPDLNKAFNLHNQARQAKGVQALIWSASLTADAQQWADHLLTIGKSEHADSSVTKQGENLGYVNGFEGSPPDNPAEWITETWLAEETENNYQGEPISYENAHLVGHYTQCVWNKTTHVGIAIAQDNDNIHVVARYTPQGNLIGAKPY